jgi:hypothetical protein
MSLADLWNLVYGTAVGTAAIAVFLLVVMIGFCVVLDWTKFRPTRFSRTVKNLDETIGLPVVYLPPDVPRGASDQLAGSGYVAS